MLIKQVHENAASSHTPDCHSRCACCFWHDSLLARYLFNANPTHICPASSHGMWSSTYDKTVFEGRRSKLASFCERQPTSATKCGQCQTTLVPYSSGVTKSSPAPTCIQSLDLLSRSWHPTQTRRTFERATHSDVNTQIKTNWLDPQTERYVKVGISSTAPTWCALRLLCCWMNN